ncbi:stress response protein nst1 isoform X1 [Ricinus communis]|uniref:stress response protein nst1 isoform X1 n=1 Tax=Ricinus communis TaxID=3988 RepID=UPI000D686A25|nr:stress response protein nst1 isoform X1 [Ricinus communis]|eukprot:XP_025015631.1 stress response protein nst1-like isoform X1 [Ricinus communis]
MCILCVIQKWSRKVATMLPWLVIPLIGLWALSQLLPPAFRFEITQPRLACVFVLLVTLFWYEILMPQLSAWRVRRNARLRERKRFEAIELQKLRKTATRRCRNCLTPYRDQNPGGGRFMCSYCGHISKRPVLDLPVPPGLGMSNSGIIKDLVGKGGTILNGKAWSDNGWMCNQDWLENGNWAGGSIAGKSNYWRKHGSGIFGGEENCLAEKSYSGVAIFACKLLTSFFLSIRWIWRKIFRISSSKEDDSSDADHRGMLTKRGENGGNYHESKGDKARRKAEEKRQARLEKELLEEEERKQREEVARLVEERRRLRDEKLEAEKDQSKSSPSTTQEKDSKKEAEKKRQERRKEKDKGSSKSNSDAEELEKKSSKDSERKRDFDKKGETDRREHQKSGTECVKVQTSESGHGIKHPSASNYSRGNAGSRYLDRMRGTILSSSRAFTGSGFFGRTANSPSYVTKENKFGSSVDNGHTSAHRRDICPPERAVGKSSVNGDEKNVNHSVLSEPHSRPAPKKSWQQLFTRTSSAPSSNTNVISRPNSKPQAEVQSPQLHGQSSSLQSFDNPISFGLPSPFTIPTYPSVSSSSSLGFSPPIEGIFPRGVDGPHEIIPEEPELFEDPCYVPDPISLLGPVSESLADFQFDLGTGFTSDIGLERPHALKNLSTSPEVSKPSPIESPLSRLRVADEKHNGSNWFPTTPKAQDSHNLPMDDVHVHANEKGTWQMWNSPLGQDGLGLVGGPGSWLLPPERTRLINDDFLQPSPQKTMASLFAKDDQVLSGTHSPQKVFLGNGHSGGGFSPVTGSSDNDPWLQNAFFPPLSGSESHFSQKPQEESTRNELIYGSPTGAANNHTFEMSPANCWVNRKDWNVQDSGEGIGKSSFTRPNTGGGYPTQDVQSFWSFD